ncbi:MAG: hypothetical protein J7498_05390 [Sphingobium sp.]|nr:hypothetical protein [Sphingobium sp.]
MSKDEDAKASDESLPPSNEDNGPQVAWRDTPTLIVEQVVGHASAGAIHRFVLAEIVFNPAPGAKSPALRPNITIAIPHVMLPSIVTSFQKAFDDLQAQQGEDIDSDGDAE